MGSVENKTDALKSSSQQLNQGPGGKRKAEHDDRKDGRWNARDGSSDSRIICEPEKETRVT